MIKFKSILKDELSFFLTQREATKCKSPYEHDKSLLRCFDEYLCIISCENKNLTEENYLDGYIHYLDRPLL